MQDHTIFFTFATIFVSKILIYCFISCDLAYFFTTTYTVTKALRQIYFNMLFRLSFCPGSLLRAALNMNCWCFLGCILKEQTAQVQTAMCFHDERASCNTPDAAVNSVSAHVLVELLAKSIEFQLTVNRNLLKIGI